MNRRLGALLLALALLSTVILSAFAVETDTDKEKSEPGEKMILVSPAGAETAPEAVIVPDEVGVVTYPNVEHRMREKNLNILALEENIMALEVLDYEELQEDLRRMLNNFANAQWGMAQMGMSQSYAYGQMGELYNGYKAQFESIRDGEMQEDNAGIARQLRDMQNQIIMGGEMLYMTLLGLETQEASLQRQLAALNRTVEEMELRYQLGQISTMQLSQTKAGQHALASGLETLRMNIRTYKTQLELMLGAELTGEIRLGTVPEVTEKHLESMDLEKDLAAAKEQSYELYAAAKELEDAEEAYEDEADLYKFDTENTLFRKAQHVWQAAQYTYSSTVQNYEYRFRTLYAQVKDYKQIYEAAKVSLECEKQEAAAAELKYQQGTISRNVWLTAQDDLKAAEEKLQTSMNDLFSSYNTYCWAVQHGVLS